MRAHLLELDAIDRADRASYDSALRDLFDRKLSRWDRLRYLLPTIGGLLMAVGLTSVALTEPSSTPVLTRVLFLVMAGSGAFWFLMCGRILRRGSVNLRHDRRVVTLAALGFATLQALFFGWRSESDSAALPALVVSLVFVVLAATAFLAQRVHESELRMREQLLRSRQDESQ